jgi:hypothetical protein
MTDRHLNVANSKDHEIASWELASCKHTRWKQQSTACRWRRRSTCGVAQSHARGLGAAGIAFVVRPCSSGRVLWRRRDRYGLGAGPTIHERSTDA